MFAVDEAPRRETSAEALASLKPAFRPDGVITAGNSSQIVDGSAAVLIASEAAVKRLGLQPRARFVSFGIAGVDPTRMLHGNPQAMEKAVASFQPDVVAVDQHAVAGAVVATRHGVRWASLAPQAMELTRPLRSLPLEPSIAMPLM